VTDQPRPVRVATWNLWWRFGPWRQRRDAIAAVLAHARPDVCGLQEVWASPDEHLAALLAEQLGMHWTWTPSPAPERWQQRLGDPTVQVGNAILSRWPILDQAAQPLPGTGPNAGRTVLFAHIQTPTGPLPYFTTQLTSTIGQSQVRCRQVAALARFVAAHPSPGFPPVVTGDLNAEPDADEVRRLGGHKTAPVVPGLVLVDAWAMPTPRGRAGPGTGATPTSRPPGSPAPGSTTSWSGCPRPAAPAASGRSGSSATSPWMASGPPTTPASWPNSRPLASTAMKPSDALWPSLDGNPGCHRGSCWLRPISRWSRGGRPRGASRGG
jgi:endonuclease/exonuclease/phosphatase family metal-dependent hydrolase